MRYAALLRIARVGIVSAIVSLMFCTGYLRYRMYQVAHQPDRIENVDKSPEFAAVMDKAMNATVRIKVYAQGSWAVGTGTSVKRVGDTYTILTCGHLFTEGYDKGVVIVELFLDGKVSAVPGKLITFEALHDIGIVEITTKRQLPVMEIAPMGYKVPLGEEVFSIGCDAGEDPTIRHTITTAIDKYGKGMGVGNVEIFGAPVGGRSGGGLFDKKGRLIGVCLASVKYDNVGIYAGPKSYGFILMIAGYSDIAIDKDAPVKPSKESKRTQK